MRPFVIAVLATALAPAAHAGNTQTFDDPVGDARVLDVTSMQAAATDDGTVTVRVALTEQPGTVTVLLDADGLAGTGHQGGVDYTLQLAVPGGAFKLGRWNGTEFPQVLSGATGSYAGGTASFSLDARALHLGRTIGLGLVTFDPAGIADQAPDGSFDPERNTLNRFEPRIRWAAESASVAVGPAHAGKVLAVRAATLRLADGSTVRADRTACSARLGTRVLRGCTFRVPSSARGKTLVLAVRASLTDGRAATRVLRLRVL